MFSVILSGKERCPHYQHAKASLQAISAIHPALLNIDYIERKYLFCYYNKQYQYEYLQFTMPSKYIFSFTVNSKCFLAKLTSIPTIFILLTL